jgi:hypothetical protein
MRAFTNVMPTAPNEKKIANYCLLGCDASIFMVEDGSKRLLRNVDDIPAAYRASYSTRQKCSHSPLQEPQISRINLRRRGEELRRKPALLQVKNPRKIKKNLRYISL